jgi:hypothetical protein
MADSTRDMRKSVIDRDIEPEFGRRLLKEIAAEDLRALCEKVKTQRNAPATAVHIRDIVAQVFRFAIERGHKVAESRRRCQGIVDRDIQAQRSGAFAG